MQASPPPLRLAAVGLGFLACALLVATPAGSALATTQAPRSDRGFVLRVDGNVEIAAGETVNAVIVINGDLDVRGRVTGFALVVDGDATVSGSIDGDLMLVRGRAALETGASVRDLTLVRGQILRGEEQVSGNIRRQERLVFRGFDIVFNAFLWLAITIVVVAAGLAFAAVGGRQLVSASQALTRDAAYAILSAVVLWVGVPLLAVLALFTLVGLPLGLSVLLLVLPAMWFLGYLVTGTRLGSWLTGMTGRRTADHPYLEVLIGLLVLQVLLLLPFLWFLGALTVFLAGLWGAGALVLLAWRAARGAAAAAGGGEAV